MKNCEFPTLLCQTYGNMGSEVKFWLHWVQSKFPKAREKYRKKLVNEVVKCLPIGFCLVSRGNNTLFPPELKKYNIHNGGGYTRLSYNMRSLWTYSWRVNLSFVLSVSSNFTRQASQHMLLLRGTNSLIV